MTRAAPRLGNSSISPRSTARKAASRCPARRASPIATLLLAALATGETPVRGPPRRRRRRPDAGGAGDARRRASTRSGVPGECIVHGSAARIPVKARDAVPRQRRDGVPAADRGARVRGRHTTSSTGVARMHERPIGDLVDALRALGRRRPLSRAARAFRRLRSGRVPPPTAAAPDRVSVRGDVSSQFLSALLMALPSRSRRAARRAATLDVVGELISKPVRRDHAESDGALRRRRCERDEWRSFRVPAGARYASPGALQVEGDASSASYFLAAGAIGGGPVRVTGVGRQSIQGDVRCRRRAFAHGGRHPLRRRLDRGRVRGVRSPEPMSTASRSPTPR